MAIAEWEKSLGVKLPEDYKELLRLTNGGEGFIGTNSYVVLWRIEELASMNRSYNVRQYAPGLILFGTNGGGEAYGFDTRGHQWLIVQVPFIGMSWDVAIVLGGTFNEFLNQLSESK